MEQVKQVLKFCKDKRNANPAYFVVATIGGTILLSYMYKILYRKIKKSPYGPLGLPLIGSSFLLINQHKLFSEILPKYGAVVMINGGPITLVYLNTVESFTYVMKKKEVLHRKVTQSKQNSKIFGINLVTSNGIDWQTRRRHVNNALFAVTDTKFIDEKFKLILNDNIIPDINKSIKTGNEWFPRNNLFHLAFNTIYTASFGEPISFKNKLYIEFQDLTKNIMDHARSFFMLNFLPKVIKDIPLIKQHLEVWKKPVEKIHKILEIWIEKQFGYDNSVWEKNGKNNKYYNKIKDIENKNKNKEKVSFIEQMIYYYHFKEDCNLTKQDIFAEFRLFLFAGADTTSNTIEYGLCYLAKYKELQDILYKELKSVFKNKNNIILYSNLNKLHIFRAFVHEISRISSVAPMGLPRTNIKDVKVKIYDDILKTNIDCIIPKNSIIIGNIPYINKDSKYWNEKRKNSNKYNNKYIFGDIYLDAWLDTDSNGNKIFKKNKNFIPFSIGKRNCIGMQLALKEIQCFFANIMINYVFKLKKDVDIKQDWGLIRRVNPQIGLIINKR